MELAPKIHYSVLIIDDDPQITELLKESLEDESLVVYCKHSGEDALNFLSFTKVDCIVLDVYMPMMSGPEIIQTLRQKKDQTPFFYITGYLDSPRENLNLFKPQAIIFKPFDFEEAAALIKNYLSKNSRL
jgi:DNA-binding response OmpR family regulator